MIAKSYFYLRTLLQLESDCSTCTVSISGVQSTSNPFELRRGIGSFNGTQHFDHVICYVKRERTLFFRFA